MLGVEVVKGSGESIVCITETGNATNSGHTEEIAIELNDEMENVADSVVNLVNEAVTDNVASTSETPTEAESPNTLDHLESSDMVQVIETDETGTVISIKQVPTALLKDTISNSEVQIINEQRFTDTNTDVVYEIVSQVSDGDVLTEEKTTVDPVAMDTDVSQTVDNVERFEKQQVLEPEMLDVHERSETTVQEMTSETSSPAKHLVTVIEGFQNETESDNEDDSKKHVAFIELEKANYGAKFAQSDLSHVELLSKSEDNLTFNCELYTRCAVHNQGGLPKNLREWLRQRMVRVAEGKKENVDDMLMYECMDKINVANKDG